jgi:hypothetical protein
MLKIFISNVNSKICSTAEPIKEPPVYFSPNFYFNKIKGIFEMLNNV